MKRKSDAQPQLCYNYSFVLDSSDLVTQTDRISMSRIYTKAFWTNWVTHCVKLERSPRQNNLHLSKHKVKTPTAHSNYWIWICQCWANYCHLDQDTALQTCMQKAADTRSMWLALQYFVIPWHVKMPRCSAVTGMLTLGHVEANNPS